MKIVDYLHGLDQVFLERKVPYARYSDDIICFAVAYDEILQHKACLQSWLTDYGLSLNSRKEALSGPGEAWEFLGIRYLNGQIDLSQTVDGSLKELDGYLQQYIRFIATGRHSKANYRLRYAAIKDLGYRSLVHEYYLYRKQGSLGNDS